MQFYRFQNEVFRSWGKFIGSRLTYCHQLLFVGGGKNTHPYQKNFTHNLYYMFRITFDNSESFEGQGGGDKYGTPLYTTIPLFDTVDFH